MTSEKFRRDNATDGFRFLMAVAVVIIHTIPTNLPGRPVGPLPGWAVPVEAFCRGAVPFFFIVSGFYSRIDASVWEAAVRSIKRILPIYVFWLVIYWAVAWCRNGSSASLSWGALYNGGAGHHLWFLPALIVALITVTAAQRWFGTRVACGLVASLALIGPIAFAYHPLFGLDHYPWRLSLIVRQLAAPAFVFIGMRLRSRSAPAQALAVLMVVASYLALLGEGLFLGTKTGAYVSYDVLPSTFLLGTSLFLLARSLERFSWPEWVAYVGRLSLGIYVSHLIFVWWARDFLTGTSLLSFGAAVAAGLGGGLLVSICFSRVKLLRRFVM